MAWGCYESSSESPSGVIVCGADNGGLLSYNADKFIKGEAECLLFKNNKHTGAVKALDFNPFQVGIYGKDSKTCLKRPLKNRQNKDLNDKG